MFFSQFDTVARAGAPALLTMADFYGTLAAVRSLGRAGIPVSVAASHPLALAHWSRFTTERLRSPSVRDARAFVAWLFSLAKKGRRYALLATSDDTAWLYSRYQRELEDAFFVHQPALKVMYGLLDKQQLYEHCDAVDVKIPRTWFPSSRHEVGALALPPGAPLLVKPRSQVLFPSRTKGELVEDRAQLEAAFDRVAQLERSDLLLETYPDAGQPMIQEYYDEAEEGIYNVTGYAGEDGQVWALRAGRKVLQRPKRVGIGLCFEDAPVTESVAGAIQRLVARTGYFGVFEAEFIAVGEELLLIDFNPRFYNQLAFDEARGLPLAQLAYYTAMGDHAGLARLRAAMAQAQVDPKRVFSHRLNFGIMLLVESLASPARRRSAKTWRQWYVGHRAEITDAALDQQDMMPAVVDVAFHLYHYLRHPRSSYNMLVKQR